MASKHHYTQFSYGLERNAVTLYATVDFNASSAPTLKSWSVSGAGTGAYATTTTGFKGITSVARTAQGKYTFTLDENFVRLLDVQYAFKAIDGVTSPLALTMFVMTEAVTSTSAPTIVIGATGSAGSATLTDLGANDRVLFTFVLSNTMA
jgi:hypothetical protein